jgi:hypothetical protein
MNEAEALVGLQACRPLMDKLAEQGYDYIYDPVDLDLVKQYQEAIAEAAHFSETAQQEVTRQFPGKGFVWLTFYQETWEDVERRGAEPPDFFRNGRLVPEEPSTGQPAPIRPFRERLLEHQRDMEDDLACGIIRYADDQFLLYVSEMAEQIPLLLPIAEKLSARVTAEIERTAPPKFTAKEEERILGVRKTMQEYSGQVPKMAWEV